MGISVTIIKNFTLKMDRALDLLSQPWCGRHRQTSQPQVLCTPERLQWLSALPGSLVATAQRACAFLHCPYFSLYVQVHLCFRTKLIENMNFSNASQRGLQMCIYERQGVYSAGDLPLGCCGRGSVWLGVCAKSCIGREGFYVISAHSTLLRCS